MTFTSSPRFIACAVATAVATISVSAAGAQLDYPIAHKDATVNTYFGTRVAAPYQWMEDLRDPQLHQWVSAENRLTQSYLSKIPVRPWLVRRLSELWNFKRAGTPNQWAYEPAPQQLKDGTLFYSMNSGLQNQNVVYMKSRGSDPRQVLDPNQLSPSGAVALAAYTPSPNGQMMAYALSPGGGDWETIKVMDVANGKQLGDTLRWAKFTSVSWTQDGRGFFYSRFPAPASGVDTINDVLSNQRLYYHVIGTPQRDDRLIYSMPGHPGWDVNAKVSQDGSYLFLTVSDGTSMRNRIYYADLGNPARPNLGAKVRPLYTSANANYVIFGNIGSVIYLRTTLGAPRGKIVAASLSDPNPDSWRTVVPQQQQGSVLVNAQLAGGKIFANYQLVAKSHLEVFSTSGKLEQSPQLPTIGTVSGISAREDSDSVYYAFTSFLYPTTLFDYNVNSGKTSTFFSPKVKFNRNNYATKQVFYKSKDGTSIPMFLVFRKGLKLNGDNPVIMYGYGGFDDSVTPSFRPIIPVWLELGGVYAVPNIRGGGAYGELWHRAGMLSQKQNVFDDFAWAAKYLIRERYTSAKRIGIQGYSNGGLLTGASITEHPQLFGAAYIGHGVLDMLRYQKFSGGGFWKSEFGSSDNKTQFEWLIQYSPLQNIHHGTCYPPTFITTSWDDDRVVPSHEFKFAAKIQQAQGCANPILLHVTGATAHDYMPTDQQIQQTADVWSFEAYNLGIKGTGPQHQ